MARHAAFYRPTPSLTQTRFVLFIGGIFSPKLGTRQAMRVLYVFCNLSVLAFFPVLMERWAVNVNSGGHDPVPSGRSYGAMASSRPQYHVVKPPVRVSCFCRQQKFVVTRLGGGGGGGRFGR